MTKKENQQGPGDEWVEYPLSGPKRRAGEPDQREGSPVAPDSAGTWTTYDGGVYQCEVWVVRESLGDYSAFAAHLPGVTARGADPESALTEIRSAAAATIRSYLDLGVTVPWTSEPIDLEDLVPQVKRWILVHA